MTVGDALTALAALLQSRLGVAVEVGRPSSSSGSLVVWPWRIDAAAHQPPRPAVAEAAVRPQLLVDVGVLVVAGVASGAEEADRIGAVLRALHDEPVIGGPADRIQVTSDPLPAATLVSIFGAAGLPLSPCSSHLLRVAL